METLAQRLDVRLTMCLLATLLAAIGGCTGGGESKTSTEVTTHLEAPLIRVRLGDSQPQVAVAVRDEYQICDLGTQRILSAGDVLPSATFANQGGLLCLEGRSLGTHQVAVVPRRDGTVVVGGQAYRGNLHVYADAGKVTLVNNLDFEDYLVSVVGAELLKGWHLEAHKAQAIVARGYALYHMKNRPESTLFDVTDAPGRSQAYRGLASETSTSRQAVEITRGIVLTTDELGPRRIFEAFYHSTCDGRTVPAHTVWSGAPRIKPLSGVACSWCSKSPGYQWTRRLSTQALARQLQPLDARLRNMSNVTRVWVDKEGLAADGSVKGVWIAADRGGNALIAVGAFRACFPAEQKILSNRFTASVSGGEVVVNGRGHGHAVGMCQYGAQAMAQEGYSAERILGFYFPGSYIDKVY
jgi:stage II sporulation protein D